MLAASVQFLPVQCYESVKFQNTYSCSISQILTNYIFLIEIEPLLLTKFLASIMFYVGLYFKTLDLTKTRVLIKLGSKTIFLIRSRCTKWSTADPKPWILVYLLNSDMCRYKGPIQTNICNYREPYTMVNHKLLPFFTVLSLFCPLSLF